MPKIGNRTALERILADMSPEPVQPDEFTVQDIVNRTTDVTYYGVANRLTGMVRKGLLTKRSLCINGKKTNVFRYAKQP